MELFTLDRKFLKQDVIDGFYSAIWTERYYGDSDVELSVPATNEMIKKLPSGIFLGLGGSDEVMILETRVIEDEKLKITGISILPWLNQRFIRVSNNHEEKNWTIDVEQPPGQVLWTILSNMCVAGSPYLNGTINIGIPNPEQFIIPGLGLKDFDKAGKNSKYSIPYGPVYDAMREIATAYEVGMQITLESATESAYSLGFRSYRGLDRTSRQTVNSIVRFSPQMDSLTDIKELESIAALKTQVYSFAPTSDAALKPLITAPGIAKRSGTQYTGFDLRAQMIFVEDITTDQVQGQAAIVDQILAERASTQLYQAGYITAVDGEIVPTNQFKYGVHYNLGDLIEVQGKSEVISRSRVTEYIRAQDDAGERAYPTVAMLEE